VAQFEITVTVNGDLTSDIYNNIISAIEEITREVCDSYDDITPAFEITELH